MDDWYENKEQKENYRKEGRKMLDAFYKHLETTIPKPKFIEQFFNLKLGSYAFVGKIDRADESDLGLVVIDYKTGKTPKIYPVPNVVLGLNRPRPTVCLPVGSGRTIKTKSGGLKILVLEGRPIQRRGACGRKTNR